MNGSKFLVMTSVEKSLLMVTYKQKWFMPALAGDKYVLAIIQKPTQVKKFNVMCKRPWYRMAKSGLIVFGKYT